MNKKSIKLTYKFCTPSKLNGSDRALLLVEIQELIKKAWGHFDEKFLNEHIFCKSERLVMANKGSELIGFCASKQITLLKKTILYIEFTVVDPTYQGHGIGPKLTYFALRKMIFRNLFKAMFGGINVMFLTPNIRALTKVAQISGEIISNPAECCAITSASTISTSPSPSASPQSVVDGVTRELTLTEKSTSNTTNKSVYFFINQPQTNQHSNKYYLRFI